ncbi:MAG TPA: hypothetical protein VHH54_04215, partial [Actinomycetota bacterium]|nr:hypothetical protein [Actinomycetota bacterium]
MTFETGKFECYQHLPLSVAARTLRRPAGAGATNQNNAIQCEIVCCADQRKAQEHGFLYVKDLPREYLDGIAAWMRFVEANHRVQRSAPCPFPGTRLDWPTWNSTSGWLGHGHVPFNDHWDPGPINIGYLLQGSGTGPADRMVVGGANRLQGGYALVGPDGGVFCFDAPFLGSLPGHGIRSSKPIVGMGWTQSGNGYWLAAQDGGVFCFGDAQFLGAMSGRRLEAPIVDIASNPRGDGYWLVGADGGVFAFGSAPFHGSATHIRLNEPIVSIHAAMDQPGYRLVAADGGVFALGAPSYGSLGTAPLSAPITAVCSTASGRGYWLLGEDGGVFCF